MFTFRQLAEAMPDWVDAEYRYAVERFTNKNPQRSALTGGLQAEGAAYRGFMSRIERAGVHWMESSHQLAALKCTQELGKLVTTNAALICALTGERLKCETNMLTYYEAGFRRWATSTLPHARRPVEDEPPHVFAYGLEGALTGIAEMAADKDFAAAEAAARVLCLDVTSFAVRTVVSLNTPMAAPARPSGDAVAWRLPPALIPQPV
jgi:hypothetical protein